MARLSIPVIDIEPFSTGGTSARRDVARTVGEASEGLGFLVVTGHGVPRAMVDTLYGLSKTYFDLPLAEKERVRKAPGRAFKGYGGMGINTVGKDRDATLKPSLHESFAIGALDVTDDPYFTSPKAGTSFAPNVWPERPAGFEPAMTAYYREMEALAQRIMAIFAEILDVPPAYFEARMNRHTSILRVINYPALRTQPQAGEERSGAHTDTTAITILRIDDAPGGLQVKLPDDTWLDIPKADDAFVINIGDIMMRWSNDRFVSTLHRVVNPPDGLGATARRLSIPYFCMPNYDAVIECFPSCLGDGGARYPAITSGELLMNRYAKTYG